MPVKFAFRFFAVLDGISLVLLSKQVYEVLSNVGQIPDEALSKIRIGLIMLMYVLLFVSSVGLFMLKKWGAIAYYIQFPFRLVVWVFSFGFLTLLGELVTVDIFEWTFRLVMILEFMRLYFTVRLHRQYLI